MLQSKVSLWEIIDTIGRKMLKMYIFTCHIDVNDKFNPFTSLDVMYVHGSERVNQAKYILNNYKLKLPKKSKKKK